MNNRRISRTIAGFLLAATVAPLVAVLTYDAFWHAGFFPQGAPVHAVDAAVALGAGIAVLAVIVTPVAVPAVAPLRRQAPLTLGRLVVLGALLGNLQWKLDDSVVVPLPAGVVRPR